MNIFKYYYFYIRKLDKKLIIVKNIHTNTADIILLVIIIKFHDRSINSSKYKANEAKHILLNAYLLYKLQYILDT